MIQTTSLHDFVYDTDKTKLNIPYIQASLSKTYWAEGIPESVVVKSIDNAMCIGIYCDNRQVGFARLITDYATFAYLADVFVDEAYRGRGASKGLMQFILSQDFIPGLRRILLATLDAHGLYRQFGFQRLLRPDRYMEIHQPDIYTKGHGA